MPNPEEETYSMIFRSLKHPTRRKILRMLSERPRSFSEMQEDFRIESSHMTYHLESLGSLLTKIEDGKYALSSLGEAAVSMMNHVEEPPKTALRPQLSFKRWKIVLAMSMVGLVLLSSLCYVQYQTLNQLSAQFLSLKQERKFVQDVLKEVLGLENAVYTYKYTKNATVTTHFWINICSLYSLLNNSTLEIKISFQPPDQPNASLCAVIMRVVAPDVWKDYVTSNETISYVVALESIGLISIVNNGTYSATLPSRGWYQIGIEAMPPLDVWNVTEDHTKDGGFTLTRWNYTYTLNYTVALQIKDQKNYIPFFVGPPYHWYGDP
jgi:DNA-binding transcriptional ArsR family regulator